MKSHYLFLTFLLVFLFNLINAQKPLNLVPNPSFENNGPPHNLNCFSFITLSLKDWKDECNGCAPNTPEWRDLARDLTNNAINCAVCLKNGQEPFPNPFFDNMCIRVGKDLDNPFGEFIYAKLINKLEVNKKYKIRIVGNSLFGSEPEMGALSIHLTQDEIDWWQSSHVSENMANILIAEHPYNLLCKAKAFEEIVLIDKPDLEKIVIQARENFFHFDRVELYEYCTEELIRQNRLYKHESELEEAGIIKAGAVVNNVQSGEVKLLNESITKYKAEKEVKLTEGFIVNRGADFHAKIAPCGTDCPTTNLPLTKEFVICGNNCIPLSSNIIARDLTLTWTSQIPQNIAYLSSINILNPIFCPPQTNENGIYEYELEIRNNCNELTKIKIIVKHFPNPAPPPVINILNSNLPSKPNYPLINVGTNPYLEYLSFDILDCQGQLLNSYSYLPNSGINPGNPFNFLLEDFFDPCKCYKIRIRTKNYCNENVAELILNWDRESSPTNINLANIVICDENGKRLLCLSAKGVKQVNFDIYDRWGGSKLNTTLDYNNDPFCFEIPNSWTSGTYFYIIKLIGCDGSIITYHGSILVPDCEGQLNLGTEDFYLDSVLTSNNDSLHFEIIDNPVSTQSKVKYYLSNSGTVSIKLLDKNFELKAVLLNNTLQASGNHELPINTSNLPNGLYYCSIEFQGSKSIKAYKIILKN
jgi:hypothetical protein